MVDRLSNVLSAEYIDKVKSPYLKFKGKIVCFIFLSVSNNILIFNTATNSSLYALESSNDFLLTAPLNQIIGWKWKELKDGKVKKKKGKLTNFRKKTISIN